jgi:hypothetical protein
MHLDFSNRGIRVFDAAALDLGPEGTRLIHSVDLSGNQLEVVYNMGTVFKGIKTLNLSNNNLRDFFEAGGTSSEVDVRRHLLPSSLERLDLSGNRLTSIHTIVGTLPVLHHLNLTNNPDLDLHFPNSQPVNNTVAQRSGRGGVPLHRQPLSNGRAPSSSPFPKLSHIELCGCSVESTAPLATLTALIKVSLRSNPLATVEDVVDGLTQLPYLRHVLLEGTPVCTAHWAKLVRALSRGVRKLTSINGLPVSQSANMPAPSPVSDYAREKIGSSMNSRHSTATTASARRTEVPHSLLLTRVAELERILREVSEEESELRKSTKQQQRSLERLQSVECEQQVAVESLTRTRAELEAAIAATDASIATCESEFDRVHDALLLQRVEGV